MMMTIQYTMRTMVQRKQNVKQKSTEKKDKKISFTLIHYIFAI